MIQNSHWSEDLFAHYSEFESPLVVVVQPKQEDVSAIADGFFKSQKNNANGVDMWDFKKDKVQIITNLRPHVDYLEKLQNGKRKEVIDNLMKSVKKQLLVQRGLMIDEGVEGIMKSLISDATKPVKEANDEKGMCIVS